MDIRRCSGWTAQFAPRSWGAVLFAVALGASGCTSGSELSAGDAATVAEGSHAEYALDGGDWVGVAEGEIVPDGAAVRAPDGEVRLQFRDGSARLAADATAVVTASTVTVERGEALISSTGALAGAVGDTDVAGAGKYRLSGGLSSRVGVYEGAVTVSRPAQERQVGALRELDLSAFRLSAEAPLHYSEADAWDQELLGTAIAFDGEAARLSRGMEADLGRRPLRGRFYRQFARPSVLEVLADNAAVTRGGAFGPPSDVLLTVFVAEAAAGDGVEQAVRVVTGLRTSGARWGLIAVELDVASDQVVAAISELDGGRIAVGDPRPRRGANGRRIDGDAVAVAAGGADDEADTTPDSGDVAAPPSSGETAPDGSDPGSRDPGSRDPGGREPAGADAGDDRREAPGEEPTEEPSDDPPPEEAVTKVVNDIVRQGPDLPDEDDVPDLPLP